MSALCVNVKENLTKSEEMTEFMQNSDLKTLI